MSELYQLVMRLEVKFSAKKDLASSVVALSV